MENMKNAAIKYQQIIDDLRKSNKKSGGFWGFIKKVVTFLT